MAFISTPKVFSTSPSRLSLFTSDLDEDLGILDLNDKEYDYVIRDQLWLLRDDEYFTEAPKLEQIIAWINSFSTIEDDSYFSISNKITPVNGYNRFEYLTKSVSRTATITRRRIDAGSDDSLGTPLMGNSRFGTITKGTIQPGLHNNKANFTFEVIQPNDLHRVSLVSSGSRTSKTNHTYDLLDSNGQHELSSDSSVDLMANMVNTNIKNRRSYVVKKMSPVSNVSNGIHPMSTEESAPSSDIEISNNDDLAIDLNRNYDSYPTDSDDTVSSSGRNYPTITRNITRTLLIRREASQGNLKSRQTSQPKSNGLASSSNEDLLSDNSALSLRSNLSLTSSISGRSEPNLIGAQNLAIYNKFKPASNAQTKFQGRLGAPSNKPQVVSKMAKTLLQSGMSKRVPSSRLPNSNGNSFGSMGSLQSNMARGMSKTLLETSEDDCVLLGPKSNTMLSTLDRKSTFRVHRPSTVASVTSLFSPDQNVTPGLTCARRSNENVLCSSQEEINQFRSKVLQSSGCRIPSRPASNQSYYPFGGSHTRSESPSSNLSTTSSSSLSGPSRTFVPMNWANNNHRSSESLITCTSLPAETNHINNNILAEANHCSNGFSLTITNHPSDKATSRIPALPKSFSALPRLNTPVCGIQPHLNSDLAGTVGRKLKVSSALPLTNKFNSIDQANLINSNQQTAPNTFHRATLLERHQWQNDCY